MCQTYVTLVLGGCDNFVTLTSPRTHIFDFHSQSRYGSPTVEYEIVAVYIHVLKVLNFNVENFRDISPPMPSPQTLSIVTGQCVTQLMDTV